MLDSFNITIPILQIFSILSVFIAVYFSIYLFTLKSKNKKANRFLSLFFFLFIIIQLFLLFSELKLGTISYIFLVFFVPTTLALAPTSFFYLESLVSNSLTKRYKHYTPSFIITIINIICFSVAYSTSDKTISNSFINILTYVNVGGLTVVFVIQNIFYILKILRLQKKHVESIENIYSFTSSKITLHWIKIFIWGYIAFFIVAIVSNIVPEEIDSIFLDIMILFYLIYIGYRGSKQSGIFFGFEQIKKEIIEIEKEIKKTSPNIKEETNQEIKDNLLKYIEAEKPYLNSELNIIDLAKKIGTNQKYLSQIINTDFEMSFINFINKYRIKEVIKLMNEESASNYTIETIGEMAGFKSKSSFYNAFKKETNETPSVYFKKLK